MALLCGVAISCFLSGAPSSRAEITFDGSMGRPGTIRGANMRIPESRGTRPLDRNGNPGPNLFHSFETFNVNTGENATFVSRFEGWRRPRNIIGRVTGNAQSLIDGGLFSEIQGADIWLINPLGVVFGENAQVDVPAGFHASTANYVELDDGSRFSADIGTDPQVLSVAPPTAFGFLGPSQGNITVQGGSLRVGAGAPLSLVGGDVAMQGGSVTANGGRMIVAATASAGEVIVDGAALEMKDFVALGNIDLTEGAVINAGGPSGGRILIRGGNLEIDDSQVTAVVDQVGSGDGVIDIDIANDANLNNGALLSTSTSTAAAAGDIRIRVGNRMDIKGGGVDDFSVISSETTGAGNAGSIDVDVGDRLRVRDNAAIRSTTSTAGNGGDIRIRSRTTRIDGNANADDKDPVSEVSVISTGDGNAGSITIRASGVIRVTDRAIVSAVTTGRDASTPDSAGNAGDIHLITDGQVNIRNRGKVISKTESSGDSGAIVIRANSLRLLNDIDDDGSVDDKEGGEIQVLTTGQRGSHGNTGDITIRTNALEVSHNGLIKSETNGDGDSGAIDIRARDSIEITDSGRIVISSKGDRATNDDEAGSTGDLSLFIKAGQLLIQKGGPQGENKRTGLFSFSGASNVKFHGIGGRTGDIHVEVNGPDEQDGDTSPVIELLNGGLIASRTYGQAHGADVHVIGDGDIDIDGSGGGMQVQTLKTFDDQQRPEDTGDPGGDAGTLTVTGEKIVINGDAQLAGETRGSGDGGAIIVDANRLEVEGGRINVSSQLPNDDSVVTGETGSITLNIKNTLTVKKDPTDSSIDGKIRSIANGDGDAGSITINANKIVVGRSGEINSSSQGLGDAGLITLNVTDELALNNDGFVTTTTSGKRADAPNSAGRGGRIVITADSVDMSDAARIVSNTDGDGDAGSVDIRTVSGITLADSARISVDTFGRNSTSNENGGRGGDLTLMITDGNLSMTGSSTISADSGFEPDGQGRDPECDCLPGEGGDIVIDVRRGSNPDGGNITIDRGSISADVYAQAEGGSIDIHADGSITMTGNSSIGVTSQRTVVHNQTDENGPGGNAGAVTLTADQILLQERSIIESKTRGDGDGGQITVNANNLHVDGGRINASGQLPIIGQPGQSVPGTGGSIELNISDTLTLNKDAEISQENGTIRAVANAEGDGGTIMIRARELLVRDGGDLRAIAQADGDAGSITIIVDDAVTVRNDGAISTSTTGLRSTVPGVAGAGGQIRIESASLEVSENSRITSSTFGDGDAGLVSITVSDGISLRDGGQIAVRTRGNNSANGDDAGAGGDMSVSVTNGDLVISDATQTEADLVAGLFATSGTETTSGGVGGQIEVSARNILLSGNGRISTDTSGTEIGGDVTLNAAELVQLNDNATISSSTSAQGDAGRIAINASSLLLANSSQIRADTGGSGSGGNLVLIVTDAISLSDETEISSNALSRGDAGVVQIDTTDFTMYDTARVSTDSSGLGAGGNVQLTASDQLTLSEQAVISSNASSEGNAGVLSLTTSQLEMSGSSRIRSDTSGEGNGGSLVLIATDEIALRGSAAITSNADESVGDAGQLQIDTSRFEITDTARISSNTSGSGAGGDVSLNASDSANMTGTASITSTASANGAAGTVSIDTGNLAIDGAVVTAATSGAGAGGSVNINAGNVTMTNGAEITAASSDRANAGSVTIDSLDSITLTDSFVRTNSAQAEGGDIRVSANGTIFLDNSSIIAEANGDGGNVLIGDALSEDRVPGGVPDFVVMQNSRLIADANDGNGGNIVITTNAFVADIDSEISASSQRGLDGEIRIEAPNNITGTIVQLEAPDFDISDLLASNCAPQGAEEVSSFAVRTSVVPPLPDDYRASSMQWLANAPARLKVDTETPLLAKASEIPCDL